MRLLRHTSEHSLAAGQTIQPRAHNTTTPATNCDPGSAPAPKENVPSTMENDKMTSAQNQLPTWVPAWLTEEWCNDHPEQPREEKGTTCTHPADLQAILCLPTPPDSTPPWNVLLDEVLANKLDKNAVRIPAWIPPWATEHWFAANPSRPCAARPASPICRDDLPVFDGTIGEFEGWAWRMPLVLMSYIHTSPSIEIASAVFGCLTGIAASWSMGQDLRKFCMPSGEDTLNAILERMKETFSDPDRESNARRDLSALRFVRQRSHAFRLNFENLCYRAGVPLEVSDAHPNGGQKNSEAVNLWVDSIPRKTREKIEMEFGNLYSYPLEELQKYSAIFWKLSDFVADDSELNRAVTRNVRRELPVACKQHTDRLGCPMNLRGKLGEFNSAERLAKIERLRELDRCHICRGVINEPPPY